MADIGQPWGKIVSERKKVDNEEARTGRGKRSWSSMILLKFWPKYIWGSMLNLGTLDATINFSGVLAVFKWNFSDYSSLKHDA